MTERWTFR